MALPWWLPFGAVPEIAPRALADALERGPGPQVVDVRTGAEYEAGRIDGAVSAPVTSLRERLQALSLDRSRPVVAVCLTAHRSVPAVRVLRERGYQASQLAGGMLAWRAAGLPEVEG